MRQNLLGAAIASVTAPYLVCVFSWMIYVIQSDKDLLPLLLEFPGTLIAGTLGVLLFGFPLFLISFLLASLFHYARVDSWPTAIVSGTAVGLCFTLWLNNGMEPMPDALVFFHLPYVLAGLISGWIYWRIAIGRTPRNGHAIEAE